MSREKLAGFMIIPGCAPRLSMSTLHTYSAQWVNMDHKFYNLLVLLRETEWKSVFNEVGKQLGPQIPMWHN